MIIFNPTSIRCVLFWPHNTMLYKKRRFAQFKMEEAMDAHLHSAENECPQELLRYLFRRREISRQSQKDVYRASVFEKYQRIQQALDEIDHDQDLMVKHGIIDLCGYLREKRPHAAKRNDIRSPLGN